MLVIGLVHDASENIPILDVEVAVVVCVDAIVVGGKTILT
jgi:hypothetical protein